MWTVLFLAFCLSRWKNAYNQVAPSPKPRLPGCFNMPSSNSRGSLLGTISNEHAGVGNLWVWQIVWELSLMLYKYKYTYKYIDTYIYIHLYHIHNDTYMCICILYVNKYIYIWLYVCFCLFQVIHVSFFSHMLPLPLGGRWRDADESDAQMEAPLPLGDAGNSEVAGGVKMECICRVQISLMDFLVIFCICFHPLCFFHNFETFPCREPSQWWHKQTRVLPTKYSVY